MRIFVPYLASNRVGSNLPQTQYHKTGYALLLAMLLLYSTAYLIRREFPDEVSLEQYLYTPIAGLLLATVVLLYAAGAMCAATFSWKTILGGYLCFSALLLCTAPLFSTDVYLYAMQGRVLGVYEHNPYRTPMCAFPDDTFLNPVYSPWRCRLPAYGTLWIAAASLIARIAGEQVSTAIFVFKLAGFFGTSIALLLMYLLAAIYCKEQTRKVCYLFAWNPLILIESINNAHNDIWMLVFGLGALYCCLPQGKQEKRQLFALPLLTFAGMVKFAFLAQMPLLFLWLRKHCKLNMRSLHISFAVACMLLLAAILPFGLHGEALHGLIPLSRIDTLHPALFSGLIAASFRFGLRSEYAMQVLGRVLAILMYCYSIPRKDLPDSLTLALMAVVLLASPILLPWYFCWWLPYLILQQRVGMVLISTALPMFAYFYGYAAGWLLVDIGIPLFLAWAGYQLWHKRFGLSKS